MDTTQRLAVNQTRSPQIETIHQCIDSLVSDVLSSSDAAYQSHSSGLDDASRRAYQANALKTFRELMTDVQSKVSRAVHEVEQKFGPWVTQARDAHAVADVALQDLAGISPDHELNRFLGRLEPGGKASYKLRDFRDRLPSSIIIPEIRVATTAQTQDNKRHAVFLQPTLRNVWVVQHAYVKLLNHKENLIKRYLSAAEFAPGASRKFHRDYYEDLSLANLPSKNKLGNLLDVQGSSYDNDATGDMMIVLVSLVSGSDSPVYTEAVTGDAISMDNSVGVGSGHLVLPVTEASIRELYDTYKSLREATSEQRRASKDKAFAATQPIDEVAELEKQFNCATGVESSGENTSRKRRRMLEDED